ncbi:MAG: hypothetical protein J5993_02060 [Clostridia bacterium]|nr:hypothetical protein [Clostridia bacterium]
MKKITKITAILAALLCALVALCACSNYGSVRKAFEKAGYAEDQSIQEYQGRYGDLLTEENEKGEKVTVATLHVLSKGLLGGTVVIIEFQSTKKMQEKYNESATLQGLITDLQKSDYVNGACVLLLNLSNDGLEIFKNA